MRKTSAGTREAAESIAIQALNFLASDPPRLARFLAVSGLEPGSIRTAAAEPSFLAGVLDHLGSEEALLVAFSADVGIEPAEVDRARAVLAGRDWEREVP
jgi:hypothetical protein